MQPYKIQASIFYAIGMMTILMLLSGSAKVEAQDKLNGKVQSMTETKFVTYDELKKKNSKTTVFDHNGNVLIEKRYHPDGSLNSKDIYQYDANGLPFKGYYSDQKTYAVSEYNKEGKLVEEKYYNAYNNSLLNTSKHRYNEEGNKVEVNYYNSSNDLDFKLNYEYDKKGNKIEVKSFNMNKPVSNKVMAFKYDQNGNLLEESQHNSKKGLDWKIVYLYDKQSNKIQRKFYNRHNALESNRFLFYNKNRYLTGWNEYDTDGNLIYQTTFKYDKKGNWIEKTEVMTSLYNPPKYLYVREIKYN